MLCVYREAYPALILIYVGIDTFGALGRPASRARNSRKDFLAWTDRYILRSTKLPVTALELYGARCGVLHTMTAESNLSRDGKVRPIIYAWGNREAEPANLLLNEVAQLHPQLRGVMIKVEDLADSFFEGVVAFETEVENDLDLRKEVRIRARQIFGQFSDFPEIC